MLNWKRFSTSILLTLLISVILGCLDFPANAHPLGNFTINHSVDVQIESDSIQTHYILDMAEIPAFQEIQKLDHNQNHRADPEEIQSYPTSTCEHFRSDLTLQLDQAPLSLAVIGSDIDFPPGVGGLATLRLSCSYLTPLSSQIDSSTQRHLQISNQIYTHRLGWREILIHSETLPIQSSLESTSPSHYLTDYPIDLLSSPPDQRDATIVLYPGSGLSEFKANRGSMGMISLAGRTEDPLTQALSMDQITPVTLVGVLLIAFVWGGFHALTPGHGKTLVGAYLVGSRGTAHHALLLGITTTITHTFSVFMLGLISLVASQFLVVEHLYHWLSLCSGALIVGVGVVLFKRRMENNSHLHTHDHDHHSPDHDHCHHHHHHLPDHDHHQSPLSQQVDLPGLIAIGISGGLIPCPSALLVMLGAISLGRIGFGFALVIAFSLGLASVLTGIGVALVYARDQVERLQFAFPFAFPRWQGWSIVSAIFIFLIGLGMTGRAAIQLL